MAMAIEFAQGQPTGRLAVGAATATSIAGDETMLDSDDEMQLEDEEEDGTEDRAAATRHLVTPGQTITRDPQFMRGHGTIADEERVYASLSGLVQRVNKLISVRPLKGRYTPQVGDLVVGRITGVQSKRWKVDIAASKDAALALSSVNLPGGIQRRKLESDELQMRQFFQEGDLLVAEVQTFHADGSVSLHTRSLKYGKLRNGMFMGMPAHLVVRSRSQIYELGNGVDVILGVNGYAWVMKHAGEGSTTRVDMHGFTRMDEQASLALYSDENEPLDVRVRLEIVKVCNCLRALIQTRVPVSEAAIRRACEAAQNMFVDPADLLRPEAQMQLAAEAMAE